MTSSLFPNDFNELQKLVDSQDRIGYYDYLEDRGFRYGRLAGDVVTGESFSGRMANHVADEDAYYRFAGQWDAVAFVGDA